MEHIILSLIIDYFSTPSSIKPDVMPIGYKETITETSPGVKETYAECFPTKEMCAERLDEILKIAKTRKPGRERIADYKVTCSRHMSPEEKDDVLDMYVQYRVGSEMASKLCGMLNRIYDDKLKTNAFKQAIKE